MMRIRTELIVENKSQQTLLYEQYTEYRSENTNQKSESKLKPNFNKVQNYEGTRVGKLSHAQNVGLWRRWTECVRKT